MLVEINDQTRGHRIEQVLEYLHNVASQSLAKKKHGDEKNIGIPGESEVGCQANCNDYYYRYMYGQHPLNRKFPYIGTPVSKRYIQEENNRRNNQ